MKTKLLIYAALLTLFLFPKTVTAQQNNEIPGAIIAAFQAGDGSKLADFISNNIELSVNGKNDIYSKNQAIGIISDFFKNNKAQSFKILHASTVNAVSFAIGELQTDKGNFRVTINLKKNGINVEILKLIIERSNG
jgi:hypothetical protein